MMSEPFLTNLNWLFSKLTQVQRRAKYCHLRRFAAVSMNFQNLYDFAQICWRHSLFHFLSENAKKIGGHHVGFQDGAEQSSLHYTRIFAMVFSINSAGWKAMDF